jgi:hypothetical protein
MLPNIRNDIGKGRRSPLSLPTRPIPDIAGVLIACPECLRNHLVSLDCPPRGASLTRGQGRLPIVAENYLPTTA